MQDEFAPGTVVAGKFRIERVLGQGGMGVVFEARHLQLDQRVALKFLLPNALRQTESLARFAREARAAAAIRGEHVARVIDVGTLDTGAPYIVMEFLEGEDLARSVAERGRLSVAQALTFILQACEALVEAHAQGIIHRDLKPSNLFVTSYADGTPCLKILDFGISKLTSGSSSDLNMTDTATVMGTPHYMSPEQMRSTRSVDARSDIWALGVILYELVSGEVPFKAETMPQLCSLVLESTPPRLSTLNPKIPAGLENAILRCLEKDPNGRFQNIAALASALGKFAPPEAQHSVERIARLVSANSPANRSGELVIERPSEQHPATGSRRGAVVWAGVIAACAAVGAGIWFWQRGEGPDHSVPLTPMPTASPTTSVPPASAAGPASTLPGAGIRPVATDEPASRNLTPSSVAAPTRAPAEAQKKPPRRPKRPKRGAVSDPEAPASPSPPPAAHSPLDGRL